MQASEIQSKNWQIDITQPQSVVVGSDDIQQSISIILRTRKGEDPLRPHFGSDIWRWIDKPVNTAVPNMKKEILDAIEMFEPRVKITSLKAEILMDHE